MSIGFDVHPSNALAQDTEQRATDAEARALFEAGREAFAAAEYERALDYFQRAYDLSGRPELLYNVGQSADRARRDADALEAYERFLELVPTASYRAQVETRVAFLRAHQSDEPEAAAPSEAEQEPASGPEASAAPAAPSPVDAAGRPSRVGPWLLVSGGAAVAVTGSVLLALGQSARRSVENAPIGTPWEDVSRDYETAGPLGTAGIAGIAAGVAAAGAGLIWLALSGDDDGSGVEVTAGTQGVVVRGTF